LYRPRDRPGDPISAGRRSAEDGQLVTPGVDDVAVPTGPGQRDDVVVQRDGVRGDPVGQRSAIGFRPGLAAL
jgi:hypothetical protein